MSHFLERLTEGDAKILAISGFGQKSLIDAKKKLRSFGYEVPEAAEAATGGLEFPQPSFSGKLDRQMHEHLPVRCL